MKSSGDWQARGRAWRDAFRLLLVQLNAKNKREEVVSLVRLLFGVQCGVVR